MPELKERGVGTGDEMVGKSKDPKGTRITVRISEKDLQDLQDEARRRNITVGEAARRGGTVLGTARSMRFATAEGQELARETLIQERVCALMVIGGNGSLAGARALERAGIVVDGQPLRIAGVPASIDNDLAC